MGNTTVWIKTSFIGFHKWAEAPEAVGYLKNKHRHNFEVEVEVLVGHDNRQVEFHLLKGVVDEHIKNIIIPEMNVTGMDWSCERICKELGEYLRLTKLLKVAVISVSEDGECGARKYYDIDQKEKA